MATVWGEKARWCEKIKIDNFVSFADKERIERPVSITTPKNVDQIPQLIEEDEHLTFRELAQLTEMNKSSVHTIPVSYTHLTLPTIYSV